MLKILFVLIVSNLAIASTEAIDSECRIQAKEKAITTYQSCVKESRTQKIDEIRKEYQSKLQDLKSYYDAELKKMSSTQKSDGDTVEQTATITLKKKNKASVKANGLPSKKSVGKSLPIRNIEPENNFDNSDATPGSSDADLVNIEDSAI